MHYGGIRLVGTTAPDPADFDGKYIPKTGGSGTATSSISSARAGPMGMMHVIRNICQGVEGVTVYAGDVDDNRLAALNQIVQPLADKNGVEYKPYNAAHEQMEENYSYTVLMAPVPALVATAVNCAASRGIVNIFAGIPATVTGRIDLDAYIEKRLYFIGTSGSTLDDMKRMRRRSQSDRLDTNVSVAAISGFEGAAVDGIRGSRKPLRRRQDHGVPGVSEHGPDSPWKNSRPRCRTVAACLNKGLWTREADRTLLEKHAG